MSFRQFVFRNTYRNKRLYSAYFLSTLFSVVVFFTFAIFGFHPTLTEGVNSKVTVGMTVAEVIIFLFSFFFVWYSMGVFIQSRKKEFGLLMIQGMSSHQLKRMVFIENIIIGFFAIIVGLVVGLVFSQAILLISSWYLKMHLAFYFPLTAIGLTAIAFAILFVIISFFITFKIPRLSIQELLKSDQEGMGNLKSSKFKAIFAVILLVAGYAMALLSKGIVVFTVMVPTIVVVIIGTMLLFDQLSIRVIQRFQKNKNIFWKKTNLVLFSDLAFRMKENAKSFFMVAIISTVAFSAIGTLYGFKGMMLDGVNSEAFELTLSSENENMSQQEKAIDAAIKKAKIAKNEVKTQKVTFKVEEKAQNPVSIMGISDYNRLARLGGEKAISLSGNEAYLVQYKGSTYDKDFKTGNYQAGGQTFDLQKKIYSSLGLSGNTLIVKDSYLKAISGKEVTFVAYQMNQVSESKLLKFGKSVSNKDGLFPKTSMGNEILKTYQPILFVGLFIGLVFFVSAGSILYFRLYSDMNSDVEKFRMIYKLGLTPKELKKIVYRQVGLLFFIPIIVSLLHGGVALTAMYHMFGNPISMDLFLVLGAFLAIQVLYYFVARFYYLKRLKTLI